MDIEVNYKNKKRYKTAKYPLHQTKFWTGLIWVLSRIALIGKTYKVEKIGMEGLKHGDELPRAEVPLSDGDSHYHMRADTHYLSIRDWDYYMNYIDRFVK